MSASERSPDVERWLDAGLGVGLDDLVDPCWTVVLTGSDALLERVEESLCALSDGRFGTRGSLEETGPGADPLVVAAGIYTDGTGTGLDATPTLLPAPSWTQLRLSDLDPRSTRRLLDLRTGVLWRETCEPVTLRTLRLVSLARPGLCLLLAEGPPAVLDPGPDLALAGAAGGTLHRRSWGTWARTTGTRGWTSAVVRTAVEDGPGRRRVERRARLDAGTGPPPATPTAQQVAEQLADDVSPTRLLEEHRVAWATRWRESDVVVPGDPELQLAVRFGLFHLMAAGTDHGEAAVGARGLTGPAYRGHVFWDTDVFVLPFLAATHPAAARAILTYRLARLDRAEAAATALGRTGARFPWESADTGDDVTPAQAFGLDGEPIRILTGRYQEHIVSDVAWSAVHYAHWSGDRDFARTAGRRLLIETARYWQSRVRRDADGRGHIDQVMGPDEYHAPVDDNAFTNGMARWNLRQAALAVGGQDPPALAREATRWRDAAASLVDGFDPETGRHEQFLGFDALEPLVISELTEVPVAADALLGHERTARVQVVKQADVLMLHHLLPDDAPVGSLEADLQHYLPLTAHGSSLSPGIHAALLARAGRPDAALPWLTLAARIDLDDLTGTTAGGLHLAAAGSVWQALVFGMLGAWPGSDGVLRLAPHLPQAWPRLEARLRVQGVPIRVSAGHDHLEVCTPRALRLHLPGARVVTEPGANLYRRRGERWQAGGRTS